MTTTAAPRPLASDRAPHRGTTTLIERSTLDNFIVGLLAMFLLVYVSELLLLVPCGSFAALPTCDLPPVAKAFWTQYFEIDPLFAAMPPFYVMIMSMQDYLYNPWWAVCLFMFWTGRQDAGWLQTITLFVCGMIVATSLVNYGVQLSDPAYPVHRLFALLMINGPWAFGPLVIAWRFRHAEPGAGPGRPSGTRARALAMVALPLVGYVALCFAATSIS